MPTSSRELSVRITGDPRSLSRAFKQVEKDSGGLERGMQRVGRGVAKVSAAITVAAAAAAASLAGVGIKEALEQERVAARTANVIKTTGGAANLTAKQIADMASQQQRLTGTKDDVIQGGANLLLTFKNIRQEQGEGNNVFERSLAITNDLSVALGKDMNSSALMVGKALNDPIKGLTSLGRAGVQFTADQKDQIKTMVESGHTLEAQKMILGELESQVGGAAKSEGPLTEAWQRIQRTFEDVAEAALSKLLPVMTTLVDFVTDEVVPRLAPVADAIGTGVTRGIQLAGEAWERWGRPAFESIVRVGGEVADSVQRVWPQIASTIEGVLQSVGPLVERFISQAVELFRSLAPKIRPVIAEIGPILHDFAELIKAIVMRIQQFWDRWGDDIMAITKRVFTVILAVAKPLLQALRGVIQTITALIRGDWSGVFAGLKLIAVSLLKAAFQAIKGLGGLALAAGKAIGSALLSGIISGVKGIGRGIANAVKAGVNAGIDLINALISRFNSVFSFSWDPPGPGSVSVDAPDLPKISHLSGGGVIPGRFDGRDDVPARLSRGEVVLNPTQQRIVGIDRIVGALRATGGVVGGSAFASGGYVDDAYQRAVGKLGTKYVYGSWDCSKFATYVAGVDVGGSTASAYPDSSPARGGEPIVWGFRKTHSGPYRGGKDEHMGVRVNGRWFDNGGGGVQSDANSASWQEVRVPHGLEKLSAASSDDTKANTTGVGNPLVQLTRLIGRSGLAKDNTKLAGAIGRRILGASSSGVTGTSDRLSGAQLTPGEQRGVSAAGRQAKKLARMTNQSPDQVAEAGQEAERKAEAETLHKHIRSIDVALVGLRKRKRQLTTDLKDLQKAKAGKPGAKKATAKQIRAGLRSLTNEIDELLDLRAETNARLQELQEETTDERYQEGYDSTGDGGEEPPTKQDFLDAAAAEAALTPDLGDDLAAAKAIEDQANADLVAARASGDPRRIADAARAALAARQNREQIEATIANTDALNANTDQLKSFGGSNVVSYRGQDFVLRTLAPPSSDRLVGAETGL